jgi:hypothetical protein
MDEEIVTALDHEFSVRSENPFRKRIGGEIWFVYQE